MAWEVVKQRDNLIFLFAGMTSSLHVRFMQKPHKIIKRSVKDGLSSSVHPRHPGHGPAAGAVRNDIFCLRIMIDGKGEETRIAAT
jgi:hypothetical protein